MKAWITKYALTTGIIEMNGEVSRDTPTMFIGEKTEDFMFPFFHGEGKDWHRTPEDAAKRANKMKAERIHSLHRSIKKLEAKTF